MNGLSPTPALHGPQLLVVADASVDMNMLRKLRFVRTTISRRRADGTFDQRIDATFDLALASMTQLDHEAIRAVADFVMPRLRPDAPLQFFTSAKRRDHDLALIRAAIPRHTVEVAAMPAPFNRQAIEVRAAPTGPWWRRITGGRPARGSGRRPAAVDL